LKSYTNISSHSHCLIIKRFYSELPLLLQELAETEAEECSDYVWIDRKTSWGGEPQRHKRQIYRGLDNLE